MIPRDETFPWDSTSAGFMVVFTGRSTLGKVSSLEITLPVLINLFSETFPWWDFIVHGGFMLMRWRMHLKPKRRLGKSASQPFKSLTPRKIAIFEVGRLKKKLEIVFMLDVP